jgi:DNA-binding MurR/RpiR family transcriptional regulator
LSVLLRDRTAGSYLSAKAVAHRAGLHESTAGRLAGKLGFSGYREMRTALQRELSLELSPASMVANRLKRIGGGSALEAMVAGEVSALTEIPRQVSEAQIATAATILSKARRIILYGTSHAGSLADVMGRRLRRAGYDTSSLHHADWSAAEALVDLDKRDVLVAIEFRQASRGLKRLARVFSDAGSPIVVISDAPGLLTDPAPEVTIWASRGDPVESQSLAVPMIITSAIILELSRIDGGKSLKGLRRFAELRSKLDIDHAATSVASDISLRVGGETIVPPDSKGRAKKGRTDNA